VVGLGRRAFLAAACLAGCATEPANEPVALPGQPQRWRTLQGGFLAPALPSGLQAPPRPGIGVTPMAGTGMFVRWAAPAALALRGTDLLVADAGTGRLWRADAMGNQISAIQGAAVNRQTALALGPDLSAWVLDPGTRQLLRFGRDGRLLQSQHLGAAAGAPLSLALADGGLTLLLADGVGASWTELRGVGGVARTLVPESASSLRISGVDALAAGSDSVFVLDKLLAVVHQVSREGAVLHTLGRGELLQPVALAVDRLQRCYVWDAQDASVKRLSGLAGSAPAQRWSAAELGVQQIGGIAVDGLTLAVSDILAASVVLHSFAHEAAP
jgi:hypothetical protein